MHQKFPILSLWQILDIKGGHSFWHVSIIHVLFEVSRDCLKLYHSESFVHLISFFINICCIDSFLALMAQKTRLQNGRHQNFK